MAFATVSQLSGEQELDRSSLNCSNRVARTASPLTDPIVRSDWSSVTQSLLLCDLLVTMFSPVHSENLPDFCHLIEAQQDLDILGRLNVDTKSRWFCRDL